MKLFKGIPWLLILVTGGLFLYFKDDIMNFLQSKVPSVSNLLTKKS